MENTRKNWMAIYYDKNDKELGFIIIKDRTEHEAENEAMADMPKKCDDWSLTETKL